MCFNLGVSGFLAFKRMLAACEGRDYDRAAEEIGQYLRATFDTADFSGELLALMKADKN